MRVPKILHYILVLVLICTLYVPMTLAAETKIIASDGATYNYFGESVSLSGDYAIVGARGDDDKGSLSGSAYIFKKTGGVWGQFKKLTASDGGTSDRFGASVAIDGNYAVVGAWGDATSRGAAYIFYKDQGGADNWGEVKKITASDGAASHYFGISSSISGNYVLVGAYGYSTYTGAAYIYYKDQGGADLWGEVKKITASDGAANDYFGRSVSINGNYVVSGSDSDDDNGLQSGSAYIFKKDQGGTDNWGQVKKITASDGATSDYFGRSVAVSGNYVVSGAYWDDDDGSLSGSAYIYYKDQGGADLWGQVKKITASDAAAGDQFGTSVSIDGNYAAIGTPLTDSGGAVYVFNKDEGGVNNWGELNKLTASDAAAGDRFGGSVSIDGDYFISGASRDDYNGTATGSAYIDDYFPLNACGSIVNIDDAETCIAGEVTGGIAITAGDNVTLSIDPANGQPLDDTVTKQSGSATDGNTLTVWNNNDEGFNVTVVLVGDDTGTSANTLGIATTATALDDEAGTIRFMSTEQAGAGDATLGGGTDVGSFTAYSGATSIYSNANTGGAVDGVCTGGIIIVDHELGGNSTVLPGTYTGTATYTIALGV